MQDRTWEIKQKLQAIEREHGVRVLYACESGSRAWGIASPDSDWDVRFIYARGYDAYLQLWPEIWPGRDVIEVMDGDLDLAGWDINKALKLAACSKPALIEWLKSPVVYRDIFFFAERLRAAIISYSSRSLIYHYTNLADKQRKAYLQGEEPVRLKKYLYAIRPLLAVGWMGLYRWEAPPIEFDVLYNAVVGREDLREAIDGLLSMKRESSESAMGRYAVLDRYIDEMIPMCRQLAAEHAPESEPDRQALQKLFMSVIGA